MEQKKNLFKDIWNWLVKSSANPKKTSLTIKGVLSTAVIVLGYIGISGHGIDIGTLSNNLTDIIVQLTATITSLMALYGAVRKVYLTIKK